MPFGCFAKDTEYDTNKVDELSVGQALTFVACGSAIDVTSLNIKTCEIEETESENGYRAFKVKKVKKDGFTGNT